MTPRQFSRRLEAALAGNAPAGGVAASLFEHYQELCRWNPRLSLIGPGTADMAVERHYAESLAAGRLVAPARNLVDLGSGAGFPGLILAAAHPALDVTLVEPRERKVAFLRNAIERSALSCSCLDARVGASLPAGLPSRIDLVTVRALRLDRVMWGALEGGLSEGDRLLWWTTEKAGAARPGWRIGRTVELAGSKVIVEYTKR